MVSRLPFRYIHSLHLLQMTVDPSLMTADPSLMTADSPATTASAFMSLEAGKFMCRLCGVITSRSNKSRHLRVVHLKERKHACRHCGRLFGMSHHVKNHEHSCSKAAGKGRLSPHT